MASPWQRALLNRCVPTPFFFSSGVLVEGVSQGRKLRNGDEIDDLNEVPLGLLMSDNSARMKNETARAICATAKG